MSELKPPAPDSVLYFIYKKDGDGAATYEVEGGKIVSYWYGHEFDFKGKHYFTGFASMSAGDEGPDGLRDLAEDPDKVAISQATFVRTDADEKPQWKVVDSDGYLGEFGREERAAELDSSRKALAYETKDGRLVLAVPTRDFVNGESLLSFVAFVFDPDKVNRLGYRTWRYLGAVNAGGDNSATCDDGAVTPCVSSTGALSFGTEGKDGLPSLDVAYKGTKIVGPGKIDELGADDAARYIFDAESGRYNN